MTNRKGEKVLRVCIGYDPREAVAFHVLSHSIMTHASGPVSIIPINKRNIPQFTRGMEDGSTEFSFSRFLTPWLCGYQGQAIFMDCDMLVRCDLYELLQFVGEYDVACVKHDYEPNPGTKFLGNVQHAYPRKNWSSLMVFNCWADGCKRLTPEVVNKASGAYLHRMQWADTIAPIPPTYNHLVGELEPNPDAKIIHYTLGTPCFDGYALQEHGGLWFTELKNATHHD